MSLKSNCKLFLAIAVIVAGAACGGPSTSDKPYRVFESPDHKYRIVVRAGASFRIAGGGQGGDAPGEFSLVDQQDKVLKTQQIEMVNLVDRVFWTDKQVDVRPHAVWPLP